MSFLLFSSALNMDFKRLAKHRKAVLVLATLGVIISTAVIGTSVYFMLGVIGVELSYLYCLVFGALISPTDPIAITEYIRRFKISKNVEMKIEGESLFNDGIAVVLALTLLDLAGGQADHQLGFFEVIYVFLADVGGGIFIGLLMGYLGYRLLKYVDNDEFHVEILITITIVLFGTTLADFMHVSSKQAAVIMGLVIGNEGRSTEVAGIAGDYVFKFWNLIQDSFATMLFVLIGLEMLVIPLRFDYFAAGFFAFLGVFTFFAFSFFGFLAFFGFFAFFGFLGVSTFTSL
jgi:CPA1 family monovalent cation:H+ antiporter